MINILDDSSLFLDVTDIEEYGSTFDNICKECGDEDVAMMIRFFIHLRLVEMLTKAVLLSSIEINGTSDLTL